MKIFVSWSGDLSRAFAVSFERWIRDVIQGVETFISTSDIAIGEDWRHEIDAELQQNSFGVLILTSENIQSPWLHYEAGALAKTAEMAKVMPVRLGVSNLDIQTGPLSKFNNADCTHEDMKRLIFSINDLLGEGKIENERLERIFEKWWPDLEKTIEGCLQAQNSGIQKPREKSADLEELLANLAEDIRSMSHKLEHIKLADTGEIARVRSFVNSMNRMMIQTSPDLSESKVNEFAEMVGFFEPIIKKRRSKESSEIWWEIHSLF